MLRIKYAAQYQNTNFTYIYTQKQATKAFHNMYRNYHHFTCHFQEDMDGNHQKNVYPHFKLLGP
jgi:hypothetical protein